LVVRHVMGMPPHERLPMLPAAVIRKMHGEVVEHKTAAYVFDRDMPRPAAFYPR
jgi:hypothetical protein